MSYIARILILTCCVVLSETLTELFRMIADTSIAERPKFWLVAFWLPPTLTMFAAPDVVSCNVDPLDFVFVVFH